MIQIKENSIQKENNFKSKTIGELLEIYNRTNLRIERNENKLEELKKRLGDK